MQELTKMIQKDYGIIFKDASILSEAFTHSSYVNEHRLMNLKHNERVEFLGDAVLEIIVSEFLFYHYPDWNEGKLTRLRAQLVCEPSLASFAKECRFDQHIRLGKGEENMNGRQRPALLCDLFEAFVGAVFLDQGMEAAKQFIHQVVLSKIKEDAFSHAMDYKTLLQEELQKNGDIKIKYVLLVEEGPSHSKRFEVAVQVDDKTLGTGVGTSKKLAEQSAAKEALQDVLRK
ncbi:ribonuclease III [Jeotgalibaca caeni]|uniref:ribonuclease III n=1 Tax=Jeotgalibaca caeni TaxID=3028623 RepID=UPI00237E08A0|nr:ribonuclease III [Jeotgalibaca caeni]MDE1548033.1 ribonuclease III [Jeotgalibaca caeni]